MCLDPGFFCAHQIHQVVVCISILGAMWHLQPEAFTTMHIQMVLCIFHMRLFTHRTKYNILNRLSHPTHHHLVNKIHYANIQ